MADQSVLGKDIAVSNNLNEKDYVRALAEKVVACANDPEMAKIKKRWNDVNGLRKPDRVPVWCRPVACWQELIPPESIYCTDPVMRGIENNLKKILVKSDIGDDTIIQPYYVVSSVFDKEPANLWGVDIKKHKSDMDGGAWAYDPPIKTPEDLDKLVMPTIRFNKEKTDENVSLISDIIGDILPVKVKTGGAFGLGFSATLGTSAADLVGLTEMMLNFAVEPEMMHRLMAHLSNTVLNAVNYIEKQDLLTPNNDEEMSFSDDFGPQPENGKLTLKNLWCAANSQEFDQVSPDMWEEFCLNYQKPIFEKFGRVIYGCCENLTTKIGRVLTIPNLRVFVSSAWTELDRVVEQIGNKYTVMWRQKASDVVFPEDTSLIEKHLDEGLGKLKGCYVQVVLRELQSLMGHPKRLHEWARIGITAAEKHA